MSVDRPQDYSPDHRPGYYPLDDPEKELPPQLLRLGLEEEMASQAWRDIPSHDERRVRTVMALIAGVAVTGIAVLVALTIVISHLAHPQIGVANLILLTTSGVAVLLICASLLLWATRRSLVEEWLQMGKDEDMGRIAEERTRQARRSGWQYPARAIRPKRR